MPDSIDVFREAVEDWAVLESLGFRDFELISGTDWRRRHRLNESHRFERLAMARDGTWARTTVTARDVVCVVSAVELLRVYFDENDAVGDWEAAIGNASIRLRKENLHFLATSFGYGYGLGFDEYDEIIFWPRRDMSDNGDLPSLDTPPPIQMQHWIWQKLATLVKERAHWRCHDCGHHTKALEAHHTYYRWGRLYWQYPPQSLIALCRGCHAQRHLCERKWRLLPSRMKAKELENACEAIAESLTDFCPAFGEKDKVERTRFFELLRRFHFPCGIQKHLPQILALADSLWQPEPRDDREADGDYWWKRCRK